MKNRKNKGTKSIEKEYIKRFVSRYFAVNLIITSVFGVAAGTDLAKNGSERSWFGNSQSLITDEDIKKAVLIIKEYLYFNINNDKIL